MAPIVRLDPSGSVPGVGADGRGVELCNGVGAGGLDGFSCFLLKVLLANVESSVVILISS